MGAPVAKVEAIDNSTAEALLSSLEGMAAAERRKHASIFNYWLSIRGDRQFPPIRDLDPLEISDAGPWSVLLELIGAGENAVIRHLGQAIKLGVDAETIARAPNPSLLACIHARLPLVASSMQALAFEDSFETDRGTARCWVTLLPFSASGTWIDYVYGFVSLDTGEETAAEEAQQAVEKMESGQVPLRPLDEDLEVAEESFAPADAVPDAVETDPQPEIAPEPESAAEPEIELEVPVQEPEPGPEPLPDVEAVFVPEASEPELEPLAALEPEVAPEGQPEFEPAPKPDAILTLETEIEPEAGAAPEPEPEPLPEPEEAEPSAKAGFSSKLMESVSGFYGRVVHAAPSEPIEEAVADEFAHPAEEPVADEFREPIEEPVAEHVAEPICQAEGTLQSKLTEVRAMAEEARQALLRSELALYAGLSAAYDFALDAEGEPEEYLRLVEGQGLKIQLRSPMKPVVKLAFADTCDETTIGQLEAVLAWALKQDLPRGSLAARIEAEGGIGAILEGLGKAA